MIDIGRKKLFADVVYTLLSTVFSQIVSIFRTLILPIIWEPASLGVWNLMNVLIGYGANAHLGILHGFNKKIPQMRVQEQDLERNEYKDSVFWCNLILGIILGFLVFIASFWTQPVYALPLRVVSFTIILQVVFVYYFSLLRADHCFELLSKGVALSSLLSSIFILIAAYVFEDVWIVLIAQMLALCFVVVYWWYKSNYCFTFVLRFSLVKDAFITGLPLMALGLIDMVFLSFDRWLIVYYFPIQTLGFYAMGVMGSNLLSLISASVANVLYPKMIERFALTNSVSSLHDFLLNPVQVTASLMLCLISGIVIFVPLVIRCYLPKYLPAVPLVEILVPGSYFLSFSALAGSFIISINRQKYLMLIQVCAIVSSIVFDIILLYFGYGILGMAYGTLLCYAISGLGYMSLAVYFSTGKVRQILQIVIYTVLFFVVTILALQLTSDHVSLTATFRDQLFLSILRMLKVFVVIVPLLVLVNRTYVVSIWKKLHIWLAK